MPESDSFAIRPAGRHILTIGRDLVQDPHAAVIELVKNAYDADSPDVSIIFDCDKESQYRITISDHGHGMSRETVVDKWMVPSTSDKEDREGRSPGGRTMQGRKGIGRYAASILGKDLLLETVTPTGEKTTLYLLWEDFENAAYLGDVEILIETEQTDEPPGTSLIMAVDEATLNVWKGSQFDKLQFELKKLMPPFSLNAVQQKFEIFLRVVDVPEFGDIDLRIEPYPVVEHFDYRIAGTIGANGKGSLEYSQQKSRNAPVEEIPIALEGPTGCGALDLDIRVYDRDPVSIDQLIQRGLKDDKGNFLGKLQARKLLNDYNGIGVYRNGFRLRPLGDPEFDWLKLNEQRIQTPAQRIGSNQVIGYVQIQSEEKSNLVEKSARDGLIENQAFARLKSITKDVIGKLEEKRYLFRQKTGLGRKTLKVEKELEKLYSFENLKRDVEDTLSGARVSRNTTSKVIALIETDEKKRSKTVGQLRDAIAVYQGQATLGKIINVILHEGRGPLGYFRNQIPRLKKASEDFAEAPDDGNASRIVKLSGGIAENAEDFVNLFGRLDPLAAKRRAGQKDEPLITIIRRAAETFEGEMKKTGVTCEIEGDESLTIRCWRQDIQALFTNLIDNSLYWLQSRELEKKQVEITVSSDNGKLLQVDYKDTGPGIEPEHIEAGVIFEPEFSTKPEGMGLGLAISGESATRNGLELKALEYDGGAWFRLQPSSAEES